MKYNQGEIFAREYHDFVKMTESCRLQVIKTNTVCKHCNSNGCLQQIFFQDKQQWYEFQYMYLKITVIEKKPNCSENDIFIINFFYNSIGQ